jgi:hypothetical protein
MSVLGRWLSVDRVLAVLGLLLAVYFWWDAREVRDLSFYEHEIRSTLIPKDGIREFEVIFRGQRVTEDVTETRVSVWNGGRRSIKSENVLLPIEIYTDPPARIFYTELLHANRLAITDFASRPVDETSTAIRLNWKILEGGDGVVLRLVHAGSRDVQVKIRGSVEGQRAVTVVPTNRGKDGANRRSSSTLGPYGSLLIFAFASFSLGWLLMRISQMAWIETRELVKYFRRERNSANSSTSYSTTWGRLLNYATTWVLLIGIVSFFYWVISEIGPVIVNPPFGVGSV